MVVTSVVFEGMDDVLFVHVNPHGSAPVVVGSQFKVARMWRSGSVLHLQELCANGGFAKVIRNYKYGSINAETYTRRMAGFDSRQPLHDGDTMLSDNHHALLIEELKRKLR